MIQVLRVRLNYSLGCFLSMSSTCLLNYKFSSCHLSLCIHYLDNYFIIVNVVIAAFIVKLLLVNGM